MSFDFEGKLAEAVAKRARNFMVTKLDQTVDTSMRDFVREYVNKFMSSDEMKEQVRNVAREQIKQFFNDHQTVELVERIVSRAVTQTLDERDY